MNGGYDIRLIGGGCHRTFFGSPVALNFTEIEILIFCFMYIVKAHDYSYCFFYRIT